MTAGRLRLLKTSWFRLAIGHLALVIASVVALMCFIWWQTIGFIEDQAAETIEAELSGLAEQYRDGGVARLIAVVAQRSIGERSHDTIYLMIDRTGRPLAGNLPAWPQAIEDSEGWVIFPLPQRTGRRGETHEALGKVVDLPGGFHLLVARDARETQAFRRQLVVALAGALLLTVAFGLAGGLGLSRMLLRRLDAINRTSAAVMTGDFKRRVPTRGRGDEFDELATTLNAMLDQIERLIAGMQLVTHNIAHDLRTPLNRLRARIELALISAARDESGAATPYREALQRAIDDADNLIGTFNALLTIADAESGAHRADLKPIPLGAVVRDAVELYEPLAEEKGLDLAAEIDGDPVVTGDRHLLAQALANLLDNAIKYTPEGGNVRLTLRADDAELVLAVADSGPGIPEDQRQQVLEPFVRLDSSRSTPGSGLGLSLVRAVARLHGARLELSDNAPGLRVTIVFPRAAASLARGS